MKNCSLVVLFLFCLTCSGLSQSVTLGSQVWGSKNLEVTTFRNGQPIPEAKTEEEWKNAGINHQPAWCITTWCDKNGFGKLYNWYAVNDPRGLAPEGWHIPTIDEWNTLVSYLGGSEKDENQRRLIIDKKMKTNHNQWFCPGTNSSGFTALPTGNRSVVGEFACWWASGEARAGYGWCAILPSCDPFSTEVRDKDGGYSVRCVKGNSNANTNSSICSKFYGRHNVVYSSAHQDGGDGGSYVEITGTISSMRINYNDSYGRPLAPWSGRIVDLTCVCDDTGVNFSFVFNGETYKGKMNETKKTELGTTLRYLEFRYGYDTWRFLINSK